MKRKEENADKIAALITDFPMVYADVKKAKAVDSLGGEKLTFAETASIAFKHGGKALQHVAHIDEIGAEIVDFESEDATEVNEALEKVFNPENPFAKEGAKKLLVGIGNSKEGAELLVKAYKWEKENK